MVDNVFFFFVFFFFKQKTAYEIVSRDWSSDVCSSDLDMNTPELPPNTVIYSCCGNNVRNTEKFCSDREICFCLYKVGITTTAYVVNSQNSLTFIYVAIIGCLEPRMLLIKFRFESG